MANPDFKPEDLFKTFEKIGELEKIIEKKSKPFVIGDLEIIEYNDLINSIPIVGYDFLKELCETQIVKVKNYKEYKLNFRKVFMKFKNEKAKLEENLVELNEKYDLTLILNEVKNICSIEIFKEIENIFQKYNK